MPAALVGSLHLCLMLPDIYRSGIYRIGIYRTVIDMNVRTLCLGILTTGEASGYEIKKEIEEGLFSHFIDASYGSIYPALTQLAGEGLVTVRAEEQSGKPDKKVYAITPKGATRWHARFRSCRPRQVQVGIPLPDAAAAIHHP